MRPGGYRFAVEWIAETDESAEMDAEVMSGVATVLLVADLFGKPALDVARAVVKHRKSLDAAAVQS